MQDLTGTGDSRSIDPSIVRAYYQDMSSREVIALLRRDGWVLVRTRGSHHQFKHQTKPGRVTVPHPKKDLPTGTVKSIFKQMGWEQD